MNSLLNFVPVYIVIVGGVMAAIAYRIISVNSKAASGMRVEGDVNAYKAVNRFASENKLKSEIIVHDGTGNIYNRKDKKIYISYQTANGNDICNIATALYVANTALEFQECGIWYKLLCGLSVALRAACLCGPLMLVISLIMRWEVLLKILVSLYAANVIISIINMICEKSKNDRIVNFARVYMGNDDHQYAYLCNMLEALSLLPCSNVFLPFAQAFGYLKIVISNSFGNNDIKHK